MTSATMTAWTIPTLNAARLRDWTSTQICFLALRTASMKFWLQQALLRAPRPEDRELYQLFAAAEQLLEHELRRRTLAERAARRGLLEELDPRLVRELEG